MQQLDAQGPAVVQRITTQFADVACTPDNARKIVEGLTSGTAVTLSADGKTATFTPTTRLGYGEAYIALALAAEALRGAGVTGCATPDQWKSVLMGGPLAASGTTSTSTTSSASSSSSSNFPGVLALRSQGQGWGQIAQTTNVQLGQVITSAHSSMNLSTTNSLDSSTSTSDTANSPTGRTSADKMQRSGSTSTDATSTPSSSSSDYGTGPGRSDTAPHGKAKGHDKDKAQGKAKGHNKGDQDDDTSSRSNR